MVNRWDTSLFVTDSGLQQILSNAEQQQSYCWSISYWPWTHQVMCRQTNIKGEGQCKLPCYRSFTGTCRSWCWRHMLAAPSEGCTTHQFGRVRYHAERIQTSAPVKHNQMLTGKCRIHTKAASEMFIWQWLGMLQLVYKYRSSVDMMSELSRETDENSIKMVRCSKKGSLIYLCHIKKCIIPYLIKTTLPKWASQHQVYVVLHKANSSHGFDGRCQGGSQGLQGVPANQLHPICWLWSKLNMTDVWTWFLPLT